MKMTNYIAVLPILLSSCVTMMPMTLEGPETYDPYYVAETDPYYTDKFTQTEIFGDAVMYAWGFEKDDCHQFTETSAVKAGGTAGLEMHWTHEPEACEWIGCGFGWNSWNPMDMSGLENDYAVQFQIKPIKGRMGFIPINISFSDADDNETPWVTVSSAFYDGFGIQDDQWTKVTIPLSTFQFEKKLNTAKVNMIKLSFDGEAAVYFDELRIVKLPKV